MGHKYFQVHDLIQSSKIKLSGECTFTVQMNSSHLQYKSQQNYTTASALATSFTQD